MVGGWRWWGRDVVQYMCEGEKERAYVYTIRFTRFLYIYIIHNLYYILECFEMRNMDIFD